MSSRITRTFKTLFPVYADKIIESYYIGDMETVFYMMDNSKVIFDELDKTAMYIPPRPDSTIELSEEEWRKEFSRKLKRKLIFKNMSQRELSLSSGIPYNTIRRYVGGETIPNVLSIKKISKALECDPSELSDFGYLC